MKRFLITTALEDTWRDNEPVLFLGEWCRLFSRRERWAHMNAEVVSYHWNDSVKFTTDYDYLHGLYERLLQDLTVALNQIHSVNHDSRYWRILIGPWLAYFAQICFDRWCSIQQAVSDYDIYETIVFSGNEDALIPTDMRRFCQLMVTDEWNHNIYSIVLSKYTKVPALRIVASNERDHGVRQNTLPTRNRKARLISAYSRIAGYLTREQDLFFINTSLPTYDEMRLHHRFKQVPQRWSTVQPLPADLDWQRRRWSLTHSSESDFEKFVSELIPRQIPISFVEGYHGLVDRAHRLRWPEKPKVIFTSELLHDTVTSAYTAEKVEQGAVLVYGQHGGLYGTAKLMWAEEHEVAISDRYLSWGWVDNIHSNVAPVGMLKRTYRLKHEPNAGSDILLVLLSQSRYSYRLDSQPKSTQFLQKINDAFRFAEALPEVLRKRLVVRSYPYEYGWEHELRWLERFPGTRFDRGTSGMEHVLRNSKLVVYSYNSTGYLEAFASGFPAVVFWDPTACPLRDSAILHFEELKRVGIFHKTPESAAQHIQQIWQNVGAWWTSSEVQTALNTFMQRYCYIPADLISDIETVLRSCMQKKPVSPTEPVVVEARRSQI